MKITGISAQVRNHDRVNISVDGKYRFSLDIFQVGELGIKIGNDYSEAELTKLEVESQFGKLYTRTLEYTMLRPHSAKEIRDYLWRKTRTTKKLQKPSERQKAQGNYQSSVVEKPGVSREVADRVYDRLVEKGYVDDEKFTRFWIENRNQTKGSSIRKLTAELRAKGVEPSIIEMILAQSNRNDDDELQKVIAKKRNKYADDAKLIAYLARQGFHYDAIKAALTEDPS